MTRSVFLPVVAALVLAVAAPSVAAEKKAEPLTLKMSSHITSAQSDVLVRLRVEPDARARQVTIEWLADDLSGGSHAIFLDGARAAASHSYAIKRVTPGQYLVSATLLLDDGSLVRRTANLLVVGVGGPDVALLGGGAQTASRGGTR
jgi:hypothetical protein